ncbi:MAG TPA: cyanophycinase [Planctomycetota bacterium]|nr:cyanophycinase [Planctomycetota bacterium]
MAQSRKKRSPPQRSPADLSKTAAPSRLVIIGGAEDKTGACEILQKVVELAGGGESRIAVFTCASEFPIEVGEEYKSVLTRLGAGYVSIIDIHTREEANSENLVRLLQKSTGVFFTGGCQLRISTLLGGTRTETTLKDRHARGMLIAGTSAGAAMMSDMMIVRGDSQTHPSIGIVELGYGLGFISDVVIDQHFAQRGRLGRLLSAVAQNPRHIGVGIDENTALVVSDRQLRVLGSGSVTIVDTHSSNFSDLMQRGITPAECLALWNIRLHVLPENYGFDLKTLQVLPPAA